MRRICLRLEVVDLRRPPTNIDIGTENATTAHDQRPLVLRHIDRHRRHHVRMQHHVIVRCAGLVELSTHRRILELQRNTGITLRQDATRATNKRRRAGESTRSSRERSRTVVTVRELRRGKRRRNNTRPVERQTVNVHDQRRDVRLNRRRAPRAGAVIRVGPDHVVAIRHTVDRVPATCRTSAPPSESSAAPSRHQLSSSLRSTDRH